jgi:hypothetical protein
MINLIQRRYHLRNAAQEQLQELARTKTENGRPDQVQETINIKCLELIKERGNSCFEERFDRRN